MIISRREFMGTAMGVAGAMGAMGAMGLGLSNGAGTALADEAASSATDAEASTVDAMSYPWNGPGSESGAWESTPEEIKALGGCTMPLDELNHRRKLYIDAQTDYTRADGTVVPANYVKARALMNTYNQGIGNLIHDNSFDWFMAEMTEDEVAAYLAMPMGKRFTAIEFSAVSDYTIEECEAFCESLFEKAWLSRHVTDNGTYYFHVPFVQGVAEFHAPEVYTGQTAPQMLGYTRSSDFDDTAFTEMGIIFLTPAPCSKDVVKDGDIYPYDDIEAVWSRKNKFSLSPCYCRLTKGVFGAGMELPGYPYDDWDLTDLTSPICGHDVLTCLSCGEEAQFWIDHGVGKEITREEALERLHKSVEQGFVMQRTLSKELETVCSCHGDCCGVLGDWQKVGANTRTFQFVSHYTLEFESETCAKCGACAERCPMAVITMDEETGYPTVGDLCVKCGQCAYICPTKSRWLVRKPDEEILTPYDDIIVQNNMLAAERFELGLIW